MMKRIVVLAIMLCALSGCALFGQNPNLSADQLKAIAADNKNSAVCMSFVTAAGTGKSVVVNIDEARNIDGVVTIKGNCDEMVVTTSTYKPPVVPKPVAVVAPVPSQ